MTRHPFVTTESDTELADPGDVKLLNRSGPFFHGLLKLYIAEICPLPFTSCIITRAALAMRG